jgi:diaminohydroxyphosphoribosylaminopyrimidine deaminase/5-amino-6-(5-phosphoribosylamino)uracil reductase
MADALRLHEKYMKRCIELAAKGLGRTKQNPLVGSVIVHDDRIIGEGYHREFGGPHAEVIAIGSVKDEALLRDSTLYVNLEPCSHQGKTPSCALLIKEKGIPRVIIGSTDPNPLVSGKGIKILRESGIDVQTGIMEEEAIFLNRRFNKFMN